MRWSGIRQQQQWMSTELDAMPPPEKHLQAPTTTIGPDCGALGGGLAFFPSLGENPRLVERARQPCSASFSHAADAAADECRVPRLQSPMLHNDTTQPSCLATLLSQHLGWRPPPELILHPYPFGSTC